MPHPPPAVAGELHFKAVKEWLGLDELMPPIAEQLADFAPDYHVHEIRRVDRRPDELIVCAAKGDNFFTHTVFMGRCGHILKADFTWGHYGLTDTTWRVDMNKRVGRY